MKMNRKNNIAEPSDRSGSMATDSGYQEFMLSKAIELYGVFSYIDKRSSAFDHGKDTGHEFVSHDIDNGHFRLSFGQSAGIIFSHLCVSMDSTHGSQMEHSLHMMVGHGTDLRSASYARTGLIVERRNTTIALKTA